MQMKTLHVLLCDAVYFLILPSVVYQINSVILRPADMQLPDVTVFIPSLTLGCLSDVKCSFRTVL